MSSHIGMVSVTIISGKKQDLTNHLRAWIKHGNKENYSSLHFLSFDFPVTACGENKVYLK